MRLRALGPVLSVLGVVGVAATASASGPGDLARGFGRASFTSAMAGSVPVRDGDAARRRRRAGCHQFCQQAGGLGGDPALAPITIARGPVRLRAGGIARIYVRCLAATRCDGALVIFPAHLGDVVPGGVPRGSFGGVDLAAPPSRTVAVEIPLAAAARRLIQRRARVYADVLAELKGNPVMARDRHMALLPERR